MAEPLEVHLKQVSQARRILRWKRIGGRAHGLAKALDLLHVPAQ